MAAFNRDKPIIDLRWCTVYLDGDGVTITTDISRPAQVESHHSRNLDQTFRDYQVTYVKVSLSSPKPDAPKAEPYDEWIRTPE